MGGMDVGDGRQIIVGLDPAVLGWLAGLSYRAADENLANSVVSPHLSQGKDVGVNRDFNTVDVERSRPGRRLFVLRLPDFQGVCGTLKLFNNVYGALRVVTNQGAAVYAVSPSFQIKNGLRCNPIHRPAIAQAFCDCTLCMLVLDDHWPVWPRIFRLPQNPHLPYRRRGNEVVSKLGRGKPRIRTLIGRPSHG